MLFSIGDRLRNFQIRIGYSRDLTQNELCAEQKNVLMGADKQFHCQGGPKLGSYVTVHRNDSGLNRELVLFEVAVVGGKCKSDLTLMLLVANFGNTK